MPGMRPDDIGLLTTVGEVAVAPTGGQIAYALTTVDLAGNRYRSGVWLVGTDDGAPVPLSGGDGSASLPRWSPDGSRIAWVAKDDDGVVILVAAASGPGTPLVVCRWPDGISELSWAPQGDRLAFVGRVRDPQRYGEGGGTTSESAMPPRRITRLLTRHDGDGWTVDRPQHIHVVPADGSAPPLAITTGDDAATGAAWSPDGSRLAFVSARHDTWDIDGCNDLWIAPATGGPAARLTDATASWDAPSWSPDGSSVAVLVDPSPMSGPRHARLHVLDLATGRAVRRATSVDRNLAPYGATRPPVWLDGDELLVPVEDRGRMHLHAAGPDGATRVVVGGDLLVRSYDVGGGRLAFAATAPARQAEVWVAGLDGSPPEARTAHGATLAGRVQLVEPVEFTAKSADGSGVQCWAMPPIAEDATVARPTILNIHGGPFTQYGVGFFDEFQLQVAAGFGVVYCNPRGSAGYSEAWGRAIRWPEAEDDPGSGWGGVDFEDVMACVEEAARRFDWVDPDRLGVQGGSYGGYLTSWIVGHTDRFSAAVSERAVNNLLTMENNSDISGFFRSDVGYSHVERPELYTRQSPATYVREITTPLLMIHSEDDLRCPISQAEELFVALRLLGRDPELVRFPAESHELSRSGSPVHRRMRAEIILEWFGRHLGAAT